MSMETTSAQEFLYEHLNFQRQSEHEKMGTQGVKPGEAVEPVEASGWFVGVSEGVCGCIVGGFEGARGWWRLGCPPGMPIVC